MDDHVAANRRYWDAQADWYAEVAAQNWNSEPHWGLWRVPDTAVGLLPEPGPVDVVELGCGTGYVGAWIAERGGRVVGLDNSRNQLTTAVAMQAQFDRPFPLLWGDAEELPFADSSFDAAISEYGAAIWCDPHRWIPEAARVLRPGGSLTFLANSLLFMLTIPWLEADGPAGDRLVRPQKSMKRFDWDDSDGVEFHLSHGDWIELFTSEGLVVERLVELYRPAGATTRYGHLVTEEWSERWPTEEVWVVRKH